MTRAARPTLHSRAGIVLAVVLITLIVVMLIGAALANTLVTQRRRARGREHQQQALWLVESAAQRAAFQIAGDADYAGETWQVSAQMLGHDRAGVAVIRIEPVTDAPRDRRVVVEATYPAQAALRTQYRREFITTVSTEQANEP